MAQINKTGFKYYCKSCDYKTNSKQCFYQHKQTKKHKNRTQNSTQIHTNSTQIHTNSTQIPHKPILKNNPLKCPFCEKTFSRSDSTNRHKNKYCKNTTNIINNTNNTNSHNTTNNITNNNITNNTNNNTIVFNINSVEEAQMIKSILTDEKILEICQSDLWGEPRQSYDMMKKIQQLSIESKKQNPELQNFKKTNARDDLIDVLENNVFKKTHFKEYNREDLYKYADVIWKRCCDIEPCKSHYEKIDIIRDILRDYDYYKSIKNRADISGSAMIFCVIEAINECERDSKLAHYNITTGNGDEDEGDVKEPETPNDS